MTASPESTYPGLLIMNACYPRACRFRSRHHPVSATNRLARSLRRCALSPGRASVRTRRSARLRRCTSRSRRRTASSSPRSSCCCSRTRSLRCTRRTTRRTRSCSCSPRASRTTGSSGPRRSWRASTMTPGATLSCTPAAPNARSSRSSSPMSTRAPLRSRLPAHLNSHGTQTSLILNYFLQRLFYQLTSVLAI